MISGINFGSNYRSTGPLSDSPRNFDTTLRDAEIDNGLSESGYDSFDGCTYPNQETTSSKSSSTKTKDFFVNAGAAVLIAGGAVAAVLLGKKGITGAGHLIATVFRGIKNGLSKLNPLRLFRRNRTNGNTNPFRQSKIKRFFSAINPVKLARGIGSGVASIGRSIGKGVASVGRGIASGFSRAISFLNPLRLVRRARI